MQDRSAFNAHLENLQLLFDLSGKEELLNRIQALIHKSLKGGIVSDDYTDVKYYLDTNNNKLIGGGASDSKQNEHPPPPLLRNYTSDNNNNISKNEYLALIKQIDNDVMNKFKSMNKDLKTSEFIPVCLLKKDDDDDDDEDEFYMSSMTNCSNNIGHSNVVIRSSNTILKSSNTNFKFSNMISSSNLSFTSSDDILAYLRSHPDFIQSPPSVINAILAVILSALMIVGGVALAVFSYGNSISLTAFLATTLPISVGASGLQNSISGIINKNFSWKEFGKCAGTACFLTLISFGAGYAAGGLTGLLLAGKGLTETCVYAVAIGAGALAGASIRTGSFIIIKKVDGKPIEIIQVILEGVQGAVLGGVGGFLGVKATMIDPNSVNLAGKKEIISQQLQSDNSSIHVLRQEGGALSGIDVGDLEQLFTQVPFVPDEAYLTLYNIMNNFFETNAMFPIDPANGGVITLFKDNVGHLADLLTRMGHQGPFRFYEFDVRTFLYYNRGPERIVIAFAYNGPADVSRGYLGAFYTSNHYETFESFIS